MEERIILVHPMIKEIIRALNVEAVSEMGTSTGLS